MKYKDILYSKQINFGEGIPNLLKLRRDLLRTESCTEVQFIVLAKKIFDANLPEGYSDIVASSGMCYYWELVYRNLFTKLGYKCTSYEIGGVDNHKHAHIWVRIEYENSIIDVDREYVKVSTKTYGSGYERGISAKFIDNFKCTPVVSEYSPMSFEEWAEVSILELPSQVVEDLYVYTDAILNGDIENLHLQDMRNYFEGFMLMYVYVTDSKYARDIKDLINEKKARKKYKVKYFK